MTDTPAPTTLIAVAYHSGRGHTARMAEAVRDGATLIDGTRVEMVPVATMTDDRWELLDTADAIIFGSPTYMGAAAPEFVAFARDSVTRWTELRWKDKIAAGFVNSGSKSGDKLHVLQSLAILAAQHGMHWISLGLQGGWNSSTGSPDDLNRLGVWLGAAAQSNIDEGAEAMSTSDLRTAEHLGARVAAQTRIYRAGSDL